MRVRGVLAHFGFTVGITALVLGPLVVFPTTEAEGLTPAPALSGPLHTTTLGQLLDVNNQPVILKGIVRDGAEYSWNSTGPTNFPSTSEIDAMNSWGGNFLRLQLSSDLVDHAFQGTSCLLENYDPNYESELAQVVSTATNLGMLVDLDIVFTNPNCALNPHTQQSGSSGGWTLAMPGQDVNTALGDLASTFGSNPLVSFELYNEPHVCLNNNGNAISGGAVCGWSEAADSNFWADGGTVTDGTIQYSAAGMNELYTTVRSHTNDIVFIDANFYSTDPYTFADGYLESVTNVVYAFHYYPCQGNGACNVDPEFCSQITAQVGSLLSNPNGGSWTAPVVIDEFGWPQGVSKTYQGQSINTYEHGLELQNVVSYLHTEGIGWAAFAWDGTANQGAWQLITSTSTHAPNTDGTPIQNAMQGQYATCQNPPPPYE